MLVDSPRSAAPLAERIDGLGGVRSMFLTHRDDVADHARGATGSAASASAPRRRHARHRESSGVDGASRSRSPDLLVIPVPGHTRGSTALLHGDVLFSGDHLWAADRSGLDAGARRLLVLVAGAAALDGAARRLRFEWVLPGHGRRIRAAAARCAGTSRLRQLG